MDVSSDSVPDIGPADTHDVKRARRRVNNRQAARNSRKRKKQYLEVWFTSSGFVMLAGSLSGGAYAPLHQVCCYARLLGVSATECTRCRLHTV